MIFKCMGKMISLAALAINATNDKLLGRLIKLPSVAMTTNQWHQQLTTLHLISNSEKSTGTTESGSSLLG